MGRSSNVSDNIIKLLATGLFTGYMPYASGTAGTALAVFFYWLLPVKAGIYWLILIVLFIGGTALCSQAEKLFGEKDSSKIVIDEICGYFITMAFLPKTLFFIVAGFFIFRFFDIVKLPFIRRSEKLEGGLGIMLDDVLAGRMGSMVLHIIRWLFRI
jgi:phosphatidylglycerophosphatase A